MFFFSAASVAPHFSVAIFLQLCVKHLLSWLDFTILSSGCQFPSQVWDSQHCTLQESSAASMLRAKAERGACVLSSHLYSSRPSLPSPERATTNTTGKVWGTEMLRRAQWSEKKHSFYVFWIDLSAFSTVEQCQSIFVRRMAFTLQPEKFVCLASKVPYYEN